MKAPGPERLASPANAFWHGVGRQLARPQGWRGRLVTAAMRVANRRPIGLAIDALEIGSGDCILDVGCGPGDALRRIAARAPGGRVEGIDASPLMLRLAERANRRALRLGRVGLTEGDFAALPFPDAMFDKALAANVMYFWKDAAAVAAEVRRVLRPGGRLVAYVTDAADMSRWKFAGDRTHRLFTPEDLRRSLELAGFGPVAIDRVGLAGGVTGLLAVAERP